MNDRYENPIIVYKKKHISGLPEIGVAYGERCRYFVLSDLPKWRRLKNGQEIYPEVLEDMKKEESRNVMGGLFPRSSCALCEKNPTVIDRGVPLCEDHEREQERLWEKRPNILIPDPPEYDPTNPDHVLF